MQYTLKSLLWVSFIITMGLLLIHLHKPHIINHVTVSFISSILFINLLMRYFNVSLGKTFFKIGILFIAPTLAATSIVIQIIEILTPSNFVFSRALIDPVAVSVLYFFFILFLAANISVEVIRKHVSILLFLLPFLLFPSYLLQFYSLEFYESIRQEDRLIEYLTALVYLLAAIISLVVIRRVQKLNLSHNIKITLKTLFCFYFLFFFIIAGEEISWGQRIFGIVTPENFAQQNAQNETNIHNLNILAPYIYMGYAIFGIYCMTSWIVRRYTKKYIAAPYRNLLALISPNWYLMLFFLPMVIYVFARPYTDNRLEELSELFLASGILAFIIDLYFAIPSYFRKSLKK